ncbi:hypothetical protein [Flavobacterium caeni]|uniref:Uncharacterized protein n=1 Tax=Flavobacterium caeni TaxID=490189 RepID=A0A1G5HRR1_9FLAO|nr:hypothetical protein [Flavobacterium caeni]SCY66535.1 hypothetical protein SAMN02927903_01977 [Flavobacterium caeni]
MKSISIESALQFMFKYAVLSVAIVALASFFGSCSADDIDEIQSTSVVVKHQEQDDALVRKDSLLPNPPDATTNGTPIEPPIKPPYPPKP